MQVFLPYENFQHTARILDDKRLGKQRVEVFQLLTTTKGWKRHPVYLMWEDYKTVLTTYGIAICDEWIERGFSDSIKDELLHISRKFLYPVTDQNLLKDTICYPPWLGDERLHRSHRSNLKRKDPTHYHFVDVPDDLPYWYPEEDYAKN